MKAKPEPKTEEIELVPDAWERFGEFVKRIARAGPQPARTDIDAQAQGRR